MRHFRLEFRAHVKAHETVVARSLVSQTVRRVISGQNVQKRGRPESGFAKTARKLPLQAKTVEAHRKLASARQHECRYLA
jgi:hypothetical protein